MISRVENNKVAMRLDGLVHVAVALDVSLDYLVGLTDDPSPSFRLPTVRDGEPAMDRKLARLLAAITRHYELLGTEYGRGLFLDDVQRHFPALYRHPPRVPADTQEREDEA